MATEDPRDPRSTGKSVQTSLADVSDGLSTFLKRQDAMMAEILATQREIGVRLAAGGAASHDRGVVGGGSAGMPPAAASHRAVDPTSVAPGNGGGGGAGPGFFSNYAVDATKGNLGGQTRSGIRNSVYAAAANHSNMVAAQLNIQPGEFTDMEGNRYMPNEGVTYDPGNPLAGIDGRYFDANGNELNAAQAATMTMSVGQEGSLRRKAATTAVAARVAKSWSEGAPMGRALMSAVPAGAIKGAGIAAAAWTVGNKALEWGQGQYAENNLMREIYGPGMSQGSALAERGRSWLGENITGRFSALGAKNYAALEGAGRQFGFKGDALEGYIETGSSIMGQGVNRQQATQLMEMAINAGSGLAGLSEAIRDVGNAAAEAGTNAARARDIFRQNYEASSNIMFGADGATRATFAGSVTSAQVSQGREFQNVSSLTGSMTDTSIQRAVAGSAGLTPTEYAIGRMNSPGASAALTEQFQISMLENAPSDRPGARSIRQVVTDFISNNGGYDARYDQDALGVALVNEGYNPQMLQQYLSGLGVQSSEGQAPGLVGNMFTSNAPGNTALRDETKRVEELTTRGRFEGRVLGQNLGNYSQGKQGNPLNAAYAQGMNGGESVTGRGDWDRLMSSGKRAPVIEELITNREEFGIDRKGKDAKVRVKTSDGFRVVSFEDAVKYFPDQLQGGSAVFVEGVGDEYIGQSVGQSVGLPSSAIKDPSQMGSAKKSSDVGEDFDEWSKKQDEKNKSEGNEGGTVRFELTDEAKRLLRPVDDSYYASSQPGWDGYSPTNGGG